MSASELPSRPLFPPVQILSRIVEPFRGPRALLSSMTAIQDQPQRAGPWQRTTRRREPGRPRPRRTVDLAPGCSTTRRASGDTCASWAPIARRPTTSRRKRSWRLPGPGSSSATSGRRPATCVPWPATSCWHCGASRTARSARSSWKRPTACGPRRPGRTADLTDYLDALRECVEQLEGRCRQAIDLHYRDGAGREAIAERLEMKPDGVKTLLRRTRQVLRECVERKLNQRNHIDVSVGRQAELPTKTVALPRARTTCATTP